jgi:hypothetical protein
MPCEKAKPLVNIYLDSHWFEIYNAKFAKCVNSLQNYVCMVLVIEFYKMHFTGPEAL